MDIKVPEVGESITEAEVGEWLKQDGEYVNRDEVILTLETDKASVEVVAEASGQLSIKAQAGDVVEIGSVVAQLDTEAPAPQASTPQASQAASPAPAPAASSVSAVSPTAPSSSNGGAPAGAGGSLPVLPAARPPAPDPHHLSPGVRKAVAEKGIDPRSLQGTGPGGRLTKGDVLGAKTPVPVPSPQQMPGPGSGVEPGSIERVKMTSLRRKVAERLVQAQQTAAILTTFNEVDMTALMKLRNQYKEPFEKTHGVRLGFMGFFVKATIEALKTFPAVNASIEGTDILYHHFFHMGVAVSSPKGLVVPVLKNADQMSLAEVEKAIKDYAIKARDGKITLEDMSGGTFTISNGGVFGSLMSTPILNPPQSGILGMHKIEKRPVVVDDEIQIRPMMYLALSYDHRMIDGKESVSFLVKIKENLEDPSRILLQV